MEEAVKKVGFTWKWRSLVSFYLLFVSIALLISGIALYISPPGRFAHAVGWRFLGFTKEQWEAIHTVPGYLAAVFAVWHVALNWKQLLGYLRASARRAYRFKAECAVALLLTVLVWLGAAFSVPPISYVMDWSEAISNAWVDAVPTPAVPLQGSGDGENSAVAPATPSVWGDAAPNFAAGDVADEHGAGESVGWGKLTVEDMCAQEGIPLADARARLEAYGLSTDATQRIRYLADTSGYEPSEVADIIQGMAPGAHNDDHEAGD